MSWYKKSQLDQQKTYPPAGNEVSGLQVRSDVPNVSSIESSFTDYEILQGVREVQMSDFGGPRTVFYAANDFKKSNELAEEIKQSGEINPLIVAVDSEGPYLLEGAHRFVALHNLGVSSFPALVVIDNNDIQDNEDNENELV